MTNALVNLSSPFSKAPKQSFVAYAGVADNTSFKGNIGAAYIKCLLKRCITLNNIYFLLFSIVIVDWYQETYGGGKISLHDPLHLWQSSVFIHEKNILPSIFNGWNYDKLVMK
jgi:hypothetical protein